GPRTLLCAPHTVCLRRRVSAGTRRANPYARRTQNPQRLLPTPGRNSAGYLSERRNVGKPFAASRDPLPRPRSGTGWHAGFRLCASGLLATDPASWRRRTLATAVSARL